MSKKVAKGVLLGKFGNDDMISLTPMVYVVPVAFGVLVNGLIVEIEKFTVCPVHKPTELDNPPATYGFEPA